MNIKSLVRKNVIDLIPYSSARAEFKGKADILLDANENPWGEYNRYPDPFQLELKDQIAKVKGVRASQIFLGNGSDSIADLNIRVFCEPGQDKVLIFPPTFGMYQVAAGMNNVELIKVPLDEEFQIDRQAVEPYLSDPSVKIIFLCSPNNPTANLWRKEDMDHIINNAQGIVVVDEAYIDFSGRDSYLKVLDQHPNLVVLQTLSKAWGMAGARMGIAYASEEVIGYFNKMKTPYNKSSLDQKFALYTLQDLKGDFKTHLDIILEEKKKIIEGLKASPVVEKVYPSDANFMLVKVKDANAVYNQLVALGTIVRNQNHVLKNCLRISVGKPEENKRFIRYMKDMKL